MNTLTFQTKLDSNMIQLSNAGDFIGKDVIVSIIEIPLPEVRNTKKTWRFLGAINLNGKIDGVNIRDLAYE
jgi:hypothetical protein